MLIELNIMIVLNEMSIWLSVVILTAIITADFLNRTLMVHKIGSAAPSVTLVVRLINFNRTDKTECNNGLLQHRF